MAFLPERKLIHAAKNVSAHTISGRRRRRSRRKGGPRGRAKDENHPCTLLFSRQGAWRGPNLTSSANVICIDTDAGITGIGEGGTKDTVEHCASALIGQDPSRIDTLWQNMFRGAFYPAGLEKLHALGGLDIALWDIKGKALGVPVYALLGGPTRNLCECYGGGGQAKPPSAKRPAPAWKPASRPSGPR